MVLVPAICSYTIAIYENISIHVLRSSYMYPDDILFEEFHVEPDSV